MTKNKPTAIEKEIERLKAKYNFHNKETYINRFTDNDDNFVGLTEGDVELMLEDFEETIIKLSNL